MNWNQLKFHINRMTVEQLNREVQLFDPYFKRLVEVEGFDSLASLQSGHSQDESSPIVLIGAKDRV